MLLIYRIISFLILPLLPIYLLWRCFKKKENFEFLKRNLVKYLKNIVFRYQINSEKEREYNDYQEYIKNKVRIDELMDKKMKSEIKLTSEEHIELMTLARQTKEQKQYEVS